MKIAIVTPSPIPFNIGGAEKLFIGMLYNFNKISSHQIELIKIPVKDQDFWELVKGYYDFYNLDLSYFDAVITTKYPAWMIRHPNHILYMQHPCRGVYDLYPKNLSFKIINNNNNNKKLYHLLKLLYDNNTKEEDLLTELMSLREIKCQFTNEFDFPNPLTRAIIHKLDKLAMNNVKSFKAISNTVANRENYFPLNVDVEVIYHPTTLEGLGNNDYKFIFTASRLEKLKRIDLLIKAFKKTKFDIDFLIAGTGGEEKYLKNLAKGDNRIKFLGYISDEDLKKYYADALFVPYVPYNEDYGLITIEAMNSSKAVLTVEDSGGVKEFVKHGYNGYIAQPNEKSILFYMNKMLLNKQSTIDMGINAKKSVEHITWNNLMISLLNEKKLKKIVSLNTFSVQNPISGGQLRIYNLYKNLTKDYEIILITLGDEYKKTKVYKNFYEITIPKSTEFIEKEKILFDAYNVSSTDIAFMEFYNLIPEYQMQIKKEYVKGVDLFIIEHPYAFNVFKDTFKEFLPKFVYSSHNVEYILKSNFIKEEKIINKLKFIEKQLIHNSQFTYVCTELDKNIYEKFNPTKDIYVIPNGIDLTNIEFYPNDYSNKILFIGSYHKPNVEAVEFIIKIANNLPEKEFIILGSVCDAFIKKTIPSNVKLMGIVDEEEKKGIYKFCKYALNPIFSGSGSNLKLIEYLSYGKYVLTTYIGLRGFEKFKDNVFIFENEKECVEYIRKNKKNSLENLLEKLKVYDWNLLSETLKMKITEITKNF